MKKNKQNSEQKSLLIKAGIIGVFILLMLLPISQLNSLINERSANKAKAIGDIGLKWGEKQTVKGPILVVPIQKSGEESLTYAYFLPEDLDIKGNLDPEIRARGMYDALCYKSNLHFKGKFNFPDLSKLGMSTEQARLDKVFFVVSVSSLSSIKNKINFSIDNKPLSVVANPHVINLCSAGLIIDFPLNSEDINKSYNFNFDLSLDGMDALYLSPAGKQSSIELNSTWKTVSFAGTSLPNERVINKEGFDAKWDLFDYNRDFPQMWIGSNSEFNSKTVGVEILLPVDNYQKITRSVKYALLFIALTFMVFFLIEVLSKKRIHPIQYLLVSLALIMFYTLLLAISEHIGFDLAYLVSSLSVIIMITTYSKSMLKNIKEVLFILCFLIALYTFLYVVIQLEDMSLLLGSIGLFIMLGVVMYVSRNVDWYAIKEPKEKDLKKEPRFKAYTDTKENVVVEEYEIEEVNSDDITNDGQIKDETEDQNLNNRI